jgi:phage terminase small subunit
MAGKPGRSGGKRPGAGRPPIAHEEKLTIATNGNQTPLEFLLSVMNDNEVEDRLRIDAAKTAAQYIHHKKGEGGKKEQQQDDAKKAAGGRFAAVQAPKLVASGGRKV